MTRPVKVLLVSGATLAVALLLAACGTETISVPKSSPAYSGAVLFNQRCGGCHTLSYAATHGSAANIKTRLVTNGPNFNIRCERPAIRVLYAIENGGFSGATMPQNIVVGKQARDVALFVSTYAGRQANPGIGQPSCQSMPIGTIPAASAPATATTATPTPGTPTTGTPTAGTPTTATPTTATPTTTTPAATKKTAAKAKKKRARK